MILISQHLRMPSKRILSPSMLLLATSLLEYGLTQVPIAGLSPNEEPSAACIAELKHFVEDTGIKTIYFEENAKDSIAKTLATEAGVDLSVLNPLEGLTQEQMDRGEDYISIMEQNRDALMLTTSQANEKEVKEAEKGKPFIMGISTTQMFKTAHSRTGRDSGNRSIAYLKDGTLDQVFLTTKQNRIKA